MCFSAEASFSAAILLTTIGAASVYIAKPKHFLLSLIPLLFALQQMSEGFLWLKLGGVIPPLLGDISQFIYMFFAFLFWPVWGPMAFWAAEEVPWRRGFIAIFLGCGILLMIWNIWQSFYLESTVSLIGGHLHYILNAPSQKIPYLIFVLAPPFLSSLRGMWFFGLLVAASYFLAQIYHPETFASVWCFFAAVISSALFVLLWINNRPHLQKK